MLTAFSYHSQEPPETHKITNRIPEWRIQKSSAINAHRKFGKWCHIHAQHLPSNCRHMYTTNTGFQPLSIIEGSKACLLEDRSWSKFLWPLPSGVLLENNSLLIRNSKLEDKEWIVHTKTDWQLCPLLVHILPLESSILWISLWMWQYWKMLTCRNRTPLQLLRYLMWVQNIHMLNPKQRNSWLHGIVEANMVKKTVEFMPRIQWRLASLFFGKHLPLNYEGNLSEESKQNSKISLKVLMRIVQEERGKEMD